MGGGVWVAVGSIEWRSSEGRHMQRGAGSRFRDGTRTCSSSAASAAALGNSSPSAGCSRSPQSSTRRTAAAAASPTWRSEAVRASTSAFSSAACSIATSPWTRAPATLRLGNSSLSRSCFCALAAPLAVAISPATPRSSLLRFPWTAKPSDAQGVPLCFSALLLPPPHAPLARRTLTGCEDLSGWHALAEPRMREGIESDARGPEGKIACGPNMDAPPPERCLVVRVETPSASTLWQPIPPRL